MKMKRMLLRASAALLLLVILGVGGAFVWIDAIARAAVEHAGTNALGVKTTLASADVGVLRGTFSLSGLHVANPDGFTSDEFLSLREGSVAVSLGSLRSNVVELPHLRLTDLAVDIEQREGRSNYGAILAHLGGAGGDTTGSTADEGPAVVIREVTIRDVTVHVSAAPLGGEATVVSIPIEEISLDNVGGDEPLPLGEFVGVIVRAVLATAVEQSGALIPADLAADLQGALGQLGSLQEIGVGVSSTLGAEGRELIDSAGATAKGAVENAKGAAEEAAKGLKDLGKGLLPKSKKKPSSGG